VTTEATETKLILEQPLYTLQKHDAMARLRRDNVDADELRAQVARGLGALLRQRTTQSFLIGEQ
jgi:hypothetical protein